jgi:hypothetical protein
VPPAFERVNFFNTQFPEFERHTGAGGLVWSSAVEYDAAVAWDFGLTGAKLVGGHPDGSGKSSWIGQSV